MHFNLFVTFTLLKEKLTDDKITFVNISFGGAKMRKKIISLILITIIIIKRRNRQSSLLSGF